MEDPSGFEGRLTAVDRADGGSKRIRPKDRTRRSRRIEDRAVERRRNQGIQQEERRLTAQAPAKGRPKQCVWESIEHERLQEHTGSFGTQTQATIKQFEAPQHNRLMIQGV